MRRNRKNIILWIVLTVCIPFVGKAQQEAQFTQYMLNRLSFNPAYAGSSGAICVTGLYHNQWMGLKFSPDALGNTPSTPQNFLVSIDAPVRVLHGGLGATIFTDKIGYTNSVTAKVDYAYRFYVGNGNLSIGLEANMFSFSRDYAKYVGGSSLTGDINNPIDQSIQDPLLSGEGEASDFLFDLGFGLYYQIPGSFYVGVSSMKLLEMKGDNTNWQNRRAFYLTSGFEYIFPAMPSIKLTPSFLLKTDFGSTQFDISAVAEYERRYWFGLSYRIEDAISLLGGLYWKDFRIGLSYDITTSSLGYVKSGRSFGGIELFLRYCFRVEGSPKRPSSNQNTRLFN